MKRMKIVWVILFLLAIKLSAADVITGNFSESHGSDGAPATCKPPEVYFRIPASEIYFCFVQNTWTLIYPSGGSGSIPAGTIVLTTAVTGCPIGFTEAADLAGVTAIGTTVASKDVGTTGGIDAITPTGVVSQPSLVIDPYIPTGINSTVNFTPAGTNATSLVTPLGSNSTSSVTPLGNNSTPTFTGNAVNSSLVSGGTPAGSNSAPAFTGNASTTIVNHVHIQTAPTGQTGGQDSITRDTSTTGSSNTALSTANPTGGVASYTPTGNVAAPTFTGSALATHQHSTTATGSVTTPVFTGSSSTVSAQTFTGSSSTVAAQAFTGTLGIVPAQTFTGNSAILTGSVTAPLFAGTQFDNRSAFVKVIFCRKD